MPNTFLVPDTLSRSPIERPNQTETFADDVEYYIDLLKNPRLTDYLSKYSELLREIVFCKRQLSIPDMDDLFT